MNAVVGYVLIALAVLNLLGLLLLFRRFGTSALQAPTIVPDHLAELSDDPEPTPAIEPDALASMMRRLEIRLGDIEDQVRRNPAVTVAGEPGAATDRALALAQRLARQGATPKDIADTCGISLTEAELLHRLHSAR